MQHLEEGTIHAWLDGELSAAEQAQAERHVADCAECAAAVAEARGMIAGASRIVSALDVVRAAGGGGVVPRQPAKPGATRSVWHSLRLTPTRAALAASLLVAAGALLTVQHDTADKMTPFATAPAPAAPIAIPSSAGPFPSLGSAGSRTPNITRAMDSTAAPAPVTVTKQSTMQQRARTAQAPALAEAKRGDSVLRREVQAANAIVAASASGVAATEKAAAPPPSAPVSSQRTPIVAAASAAGGAGAVVADRRSEPARALDSLDKTRPDTVRAAVDSRRAFQSSPLRLENVTTTGLAQSRLDIAGCYQIKFDSSAVSRLLPDRFALLPPTGKAAPNVVRAVTPDGRMDSVVTGSNWVQISNDKAQIQSTFGNKHQVVSLQLTSLGGVSGQASTPDGMRPIGVARTTCRP